MTPLEFVERYYLHDSNIERVDFDADKKDSHADNRVLLLVATVV